MSCIKLEFVAKPHFSSEQSSGHVFAIEILRHSQFRKRKTKSTNYLIELSELILFAKIRSVSFLLENMACFDNYLHCHMKYHLDLSIDSAKIEIEFFVRFSTKTVSITQHTANLLCVIAFLFSLLFLSLDIAFIFYHSFCLNSFAYQTTQTTGF